MRVRLQRWVRSRKREAVSDAAYPFRRTFIIVEAFIAVAALGGAVQLFTDTATPDISALDSLGLTSWTLPGIWLLVSVAVPSTVAVVLAWPRSSSAPIAVLVACGLLLVELLVQIPFLGPSMLQLVLGVTAIVVATLAVRARALGWR